MEEDLYFYETGTKVTKAELAAVPLIRPDFHADSQTGGLADSKYTIAHANVR